ncbi:hypothetical protein GCM10009687_29640 [Asanoa iriomotensis]|uniref:Uncharacterized protein n=2 Tax=Asanoa iriomotensis TaxID=234613 RepID=A0ABQ4CDH1_9ACTN|nr:hypothetical protein Air01nite_66010 [Asanoa iriomotensis]
MELELGVDESLLLLRTWQALASGASERIANGLTDHRRTAYLRLDRETLPKLERFLARRTGAGAVAWRALPDIRPAATAALANVEPPSGADLFFLPDVPAHPDPRPRRATRGADAGDLLNLRYPYWDIRPPKSAGFRARLARAVSGKAPAKLHPLEALALEATDPRNGRRAAITAAFRALCERRGTGITQRHEHLLELLAVPAMTRKTPAGDAELAVLLYRAYKLATFARSTRYLDAAHAGWDDGLGVTIPFARSDLDYLPVTMNPKLRGLPVPARWVRLWDRWVEPYDDRHAALFTELTDPARPWLDSRTLKDEPEVAARLGAIFELSAFDVDPGVPTPELVGWLFRLMLYDGVAATMAKQAREARDTDDPRWRPPPRPRVRTTPIPPATVTDGADEELVERLRDRVDLLERGTGRKDRLLRDWFDDEQALYEWTVMFGRATGSGDLDDRVRLLSGLVQAVGMRLKLDEPGHDRIRAFMPSLQALSVNLLNLRPEALPTAFRHTLDVATPATAGAYAANIHRSLAIAHSKRHRYVEALADLAQANAWLEAAQHLSPRSERAVLAATETAQQLALQGNGLHVRVFEWFIGHPARAMPGSDSTDLRVRRKLRAFSSQALTSASTALTTLELLQDRFDLPARRDPTRAATAGWQVNTRLMYMRALLWRAMVLALDAADRRRSAAERQQYARSADALCDYVPVLYREVTGLPLSVPNLCELTRISLAHAFMRRLAFMWPAPARADLLPAHLARPARHRRFDVEAASRYLLAHHHKAGALAQITYAPLRKVLDERSRPADWDGDSPYARWSRLPETVTGLRRTFVPAQLLRLPNVPSPVPTARLWVTRPDGAAST